MSQTSKVNLQIRQAIIAFLSPGTTATNNGLKSHVVPTMSLRAVQEATQKLTREGVLVQTKSNGKVWYGAAPTETFRIQFKYAGGWLNSANDGTTQRFASVEAAEEAIAQQTDGFEYRVVPTAEAVEV